MKNQDVLGVINKCHCSVNQAIYLLLLTKNNIDTAAKLFKSEKLEAQPISQGQLRVLQGNPNGDILLVSEECNYKCLSPGAEKKLSKEIVSKFVYKGQCSEIILNSRSTALSILRELRKKWPEVSRILIDNEVLSGQIFEYRGETFQCE